ncbi:maleylpyruvate isomerase family mycothiol-dependent enzyme [Spirillospora sp. CA-253888]
MDRCAAFRRETRAFEGAARGAVGRQAPRVPSCPEWTLTDLVWHLGQVHRMVIAILRDRLDAPPDPAAVPLPGDRAGWPDPGRSPTHGPVPASLVDWFADGAALLAELFETRDPDEPVWTWWHDRSAGFWLRMQAVEAAVHRWDADNALGAARPVEAGLAADAVAQNCEVMAPARRAMLKAPDGAGERFRFRRTDGPGAWTVRIDGEARLVEGPGDVEVAGTASDLMLFLWNRVPADRLEVSGDRSVLDRYFVLVPPV